METLQRLHNRGSISTGGYAISNSLLLDNSDTSMDFNHHQMSPGGDDQWSAQANAGTDSEKATISLWIKRAKLSPSSGAGQYARLFQFQTGGNATALYFVDDQLTMYDDVTSASLKTTRKFRDTSAWYHIVLAMDSTQSTAANRVKLYVNGVQETSWATEDYGNQNSDLAMFSTTNVTFYLGCASGNGQGYSFDGYITEFNFVDGAQKAASDFGEYDEDSGVWKPKEYTDSYGTLGCYYNFEDTSNNRFNDESGNGNFMNNRGGSFEGAITTDTPTNNFATLNPIHVYSNSALPTISHGATKLTTTNQAWWTTAVANMAITSGKWYFEARSATSSTHLSAIGYGDEADIENWGIDRNANRQCHVGRTHSGGVQTKSYAYIGSDTEGASYGRIFPNGTSPSTRVNYIYTDVIGVAIDADNGYAYWHKNGTYINSGDPTSGSSGTGGYAVPSGTGTNGTLIPAVGAYWHISVGVIEVNFGGYTEMSISSAASDANGYGTFEYAPPSGYYALCTKNLAEYG